MLAALVFASLVIPALALSVLPAPDGNHTALHRAAEEGDASAARAIMDAMPEYERRSALDRLDRQGMTPLGYAARLGSVSLVRLFVESGASVDLCDPHGRWTPLMEACDQQHADVVLYLLEHGANPNAVNHDGRSPLVLALNGGVFMQYGPKGDRNATIEALLRKGATLSSLIAAYDALRATLGKQAAKIESLEAENARLRDLAKKPAPEASKP